MIIEEEVLVKKEGSSSKRVVVTGCGNAYDADAMISSLIELMEILKKNGIEVVTTDQSGVDYHVRHAAKHVGVSMKIAPMHLIPQSLDRETPHHKVSYCTGSYRTGYETIVIEGRKYDRNPFSREYIIVLREDKNGYLSLADTPKKQSSRRQLRSLAVKSAPQPVSVSWDEAIVNIATSGIAPINATTSARAPERDPRDVVREYTEELNMIFGAKLRINPSDPHAVHDSEAIDYLIDRTPLGESTIYLLRFEEAIRARDSAEEAERYERAARAQTNEDESWTVGGF